MEVVRELPVARGRAPASSGTRPAAGRAGRSAAPRVSSPSTRSEPHAVGLACSTRSRRRRPTTRWIVIPTIGSLDRAVAARERQRRSVSWPPVAISRAGAPSRSRSVDARRSSPPGCRAVAAQLERARPARRSGAGVRSSVAELHRRRGTRRPPSPRRRRRARRRPGATRRGSHSLGDLCRGRARPTPASCRAARSSWMRSMHFAWKRRSPTAITSSSSSASGSQLGDHAEGQAQLHALAVGPHRRVGEVLELGELDHRRRAARCASRATPAVHDAAR